MALVRSPERKNWPPHSSHVIQLTGTIFELNSQNAPPTGGHVFQLTGTIFKLVRDINKTNVLTNFHDNWAKIVTSRVFTRENCHYIHTEKNAPPTCGHVFSPISTIFDLVRDINLTNVLTNFYDDWTKIVTSKSVYKENCPAHWRPSIFELNQDIIKTNILTNFELGRDLIGTKLLTKFHEDGTRNVASRVFTSKFTKAHLSNQKSLTDGRTDRDKPISPLR
ncbi:hypothetical protein DPMN_071888 [Dreissena polymorpha]|uniref:Uncharacterized protein n=1 Tax=Dreissena polymorpha TaxID=45954 RepID=A0A9D4BW38_DREPO|nr:hypothetical protein DPMN_071888 [Dreissena polymorpha]